MDEIDIEIIKLLIINSRLSYRELAVYLDLSINAIYRRIQSLIDLGIIQQFTAKINPNAINAIYSFIFGETKAENINDMISVLGAHENTYNIMLSSRNHIYIGAFLKDVHELDEYFSFVARTAQLKTPTLGLLHKVFYSSPIRYENPLTRTMDLDELDLSIIRSLSNDSRKPISEVAEETNSSSKTIRRRLSRLINEGLIRLTIHFNPFSSDYIFALLQIYLSTSVNKEDFVKILTTKFKPNIISCWIFSNVPNFLLCYTWTKTIDELNNLMEELRKEQVETVIPDILFQEYYYDTWREDVLKNIKKK